MPIDSSPAGLVQSSEAPKAPGPLHGWAMIWTLLSIFVGGMALNLKKPVIIDFYATWCTPCRELEEVSFHDPLVVKQAESDFVMIKVDVTKEKNPLHERLLEQYDVKGIPTIVFLDTSGKEKRELRLVDYLPPDQLLGRMAELKKSGR